MDMHNNTRWGILLGLGLIALGLALRAREARAAGLDAVSCRVAATNADGSTSGGSGTLVDVSADGELGVVLTNSHVVADSRGPYKVTFADGASHGALLVAHDPDLDLAALKIAKPGRRPARWVSAVAGETFFACGFGSFQERFRVTSGQVVAHLGTPTGRQRSYELNGGSRQGDSGGGVFNERGELCGVRWGGDAGRTTFVAPEQVAEFLGRLGIGTVPPTQCGVGMACGSGGGTFNARGELCGAGIAWGGQCGPGRVCPQQPAGRPVYALPLAPAAPVVIAGPPVSLQAPAAAGPGTDRLADEGADGGCECAGDCACDDACAAGLAKLQGQVATLEARLGVLAARPESPPVDLDQVAGAVIDRLPPILVEQQDYYTGAVLDRGQVRLGETLVMRFGVKGDHARPQ